MSHDMHTLIDRLAWIDAYLSFYRLRPRDLCGAVRGLHHAQIEEVRSAVAAALGAEHERGDTTLGLRFADAYAQAMVALGFERLSFDQLTIRLAAQPADRLWLPDLSLPASRANGAE